MEKANAKSPLQLSQQAVDQAAQKKPKKPEPEPLPYYPAVDFSKRETCIKPNAVGLSREPYIGVFHGERPFSPQIDPGHKPKGY
jgi:hypothetical protein